MMDFNEAIGGLRADDCVPQLVSDRIEETLAALPDAMSDNPGGPVIDEERQEAKRPRRAYWAVASIAACALLAAVLVTVPALSGTNGGQSGTAAVASGGAAASASEGVAIVNAFSVELAYASEYGVSQAGFESADGNDGQAGAIAFENTDVNVNNFIGMQVRVTGENIATVRVSVDKGDIYWCKTVSCTADQEWQAYETYRRLIWLSAVASGLDRKGAFDSLNDLMFNNDRILLGRRSPVDENDCSVTYCEKGGSSFEASYDEDVRYGLLLPNDEYQAIRERLIQEGNYRSIMNYLCDYFDGATLTVEVTYRDGSTDQKRYKIKAGYLACTWRDLGYEIPGIGRGRERIVFDRFAEEGEDSVYGMLAIPIAD